MFACSFILKFTYSKEHSFFHTVLEVLTNTTTMLRLQNVPVTAGKWGEHYLYFFFFQTFIYSQLCNLQTTNSEFINNQRKKRMHYIFFFKFYFIFKLYIIVLVLPNIKMNLPQVYMCSPS